MAVKLPGFEGATRRAGRVGRVPSAQGMNPGGVRATYNVPSLGQLSRGITAGAGAQARYASQTGGGFRAFSQFAAQMGRQEQQRLAAEQAAQDKLALAMANAQFLAANEKAQAALTDPDYSTYEERYSEAIEGAREDIAIGLPDHLKQDFEIATLPGIARGQVAVAKQARGAYQKSVLDKLDAMEEAMPSAGITVAAQTEYVQAYSQAIEAAVAQGIITPEEAMLRRNRVASGIAKAEIGNWFRAQPDPYGAAVQIHEGAIPDPRVQQLLDMLSPEDRTEVFDGVVGEESKLATLRNIQEQLADDGAKEADLAAVKQFFLDPEMTNSERYDTVQMAIRSPHVSPSVAQQMQRRMTQGVETNDQDKRFATNEISTGNIRSPDQLIEIMGEMGWEISDADLIRLNGEIDNMQNKRFTAAMKWGAAKIGIPQTGGFLGDFLGPSVDRLSEFQADMHAYRFENPDGEFMKYAQELLEGDVSETNNQAAAAIPIMAAEYRKALASGDADRIQSARAGLLSVMQASGMVEPMQALDPNFDPFSVLPGGGGGGQTNP